MICLALKLKQMILIHCNYSKVSSNVKYAHYSYIKLLVIFSNE